MAKKKYSLAGIDGNAFNILGYTARAMRETGFTREEIEAYYEDAKSNDYNHLVVVSSDMIDKANKRNNNGKDY